MKAGVRPGISACVDAVEHERVIVKIRVHTSARPLYDGDGSRTPMGNVLIPGRPPQPAEHRAECGWKIDGKGHAAEKLGLHPNTLRSRMQKLGISRPARRA